MLLGVDDLCLVVVGSRDGLLLELTPTGADQNGGDWHQVDMANVGQKLSLRCQETLQAGRPIVIEDMSKAELCSPLMVERAQAGARSFLMMPLYYEGEKVGVFTLASATPPLSSVPNQRRSTSPRSAPS